MVVQNTQFDPDTGEPIAPASALAPAAPAAPAAPDNSAAISSLAAQLGGDSPQTRALAQGLFDRGITNLSDIAWKEGKPGYWSTQDDSQSGGSQTNVWVDDPTRINYDFYNKVTNAPIDPMRIGAYDIPDKGTYFYNLTPNGFESWFNERSRGYAPALATFLSMTPLAPVAAAYNAYKAIDNGDVIGGLANIASMGGMSGLSNELKVVNAIKQGNVGDALVSLGQMALPGELGQTKIGDFTLSDIAKGASIASNINSGNYTAALQAAGELAGSPNTVMAAKGASLLQALNSGNPQAILNAAASLGQTVNGVAPGAVKTMAPIVDGTSNATPGNQAALTGGTLAQPSTGTTGDAGADAILAASQGVGQIGGSGTQVAALDTGTRTDASSGTAVTGGATTGFGGNVVDSEGNVVNAVVRGLKDDDVDRSWKSKTGDPIAGTEQVDPVSGQVIPDSALRNTLTQAYAIAGPTSSSEYSSELPSGYRFLTVDDENKNTPFTTIQINGVNYAITSPNIKVNDATTNSQLPRYQKQVETDANGFINAGFSPADAWTKALSNNGLTDADLIRPTWAVPGGGLTGGQTSGSTAASTTGPTQGAGSTQESTTGPTQGAKSTQESTAGSTQGGGSTTGGTTGLTGATGSDTVDPFAGYVRPTAPDTSGGGQLPSGWTTPTAAAAPDLGGPPTGVSVARNTGPGGPLEDLSQQGGGLGENIAAAAGDSNGTRNLGPGGPLEDYSQQGGSAVETIVTPATETKTQPAVTTKTTTTAPPAGTATTSTPVSVTSPVQITSTEAAPETTSTFKVGNLGKYVSPLAAYQAMVQQVYNTAMDEKVRQEQKPKEKDLETDTSFWGYGQQEKPIESIFDTVGSLFQQPEVKAATGGSIAALMAAGGAQKTGIGSTALVPHSGKMRVDFRRGDAVTGPGDGQSDDIPAMLADGEFVFPADVVSALGNGSTKAGSDKLYEMMHAIRARARKAHPKSLPPPAKSPLEYLRGKK